MSYIKSGALISNCEKYRFRLWRIWDTSLPLVMFVMHNPSTADGEEDDPTIRRCISFAKSWGYGGMYVGNLFPYRATDPKKLIGLDVETLWPISNIRHINEMASMCSLHVLAYGNPFRKDMVPDKSFFDDKWHYLKLTNAGNPCHPLYLKSNLHPVKFL
jgi:hypothetical protein